MAALMRTATIAELQRIRVDRVAAATLAPNQPRTRLGARIVANTRRSWALAPARRLCDRAIEVVGAQRPLAMRWRRRDGSLEALATP